MADKSVPEEIADIIVDCYSEDEQEMAWEVAFQDGVKLRFEATLLGTAVKIMDFRLGPAGNIQCQIARDNEERWVGIDDLDEDDLPPDFQHMIELYQAWLPGDY